MTVSPGALARLGHGLRDFTFSSTLYNLSLGRRAVNGLVGVPADPWPGSAVNGAALLEKTLRLPGRSLTLKGSPLTETFWYPEDGDPAWFRTLHGFLWLRDLRAHGGDDARRLARLLVMGWLEHHSFCDGWSWSSELLASRIASWVAAHDFFWASADESFRACMLDSLARQTRHLARTLPSGCNGNGFLTLVKGLVYGSLALRNGRRVRAQAIKLLESELPTRLFPDGCHGSRSPFEQARVLQELLDIRAGLRAAKAPAPDILGLAIERMGLLLRLFRHGDGGLALFNGSQEGDPDLIDAILTAAEVRGRPLRRSPYGGYERLVAGRALVIVDAGEPAPAGFDALAHAGTLSFEFSYARERIIVNCGAHPGRLEPWRSALAKTAAHSTLSVADTSSSEILEGGGLGRRPSHVASDREDADGGAAVSVSHTGFSPNFGWVHRRRLMIAAGGERLDGEDSLEPAVGRSGQAAPVTVRFHLHPQVDVGIAQDERQVFLYLPASGTWVFEAPGHLPEVTDSVYFGTGANPRPCRQIVLTTQTQENGLRLAWSLHRQSNGS